MSLKLTSNTVCEATQGRLIQQGAQEFLGLTTDTRKENEGMLFFPLKGERFDGHDYIEQAISSGATGVVVEKRAVSSAKKSSEITIIEVDDSLVALQSLANWWRKNSSARVVAITGSNGKTTTKDFASTILNAHYRVCSTKGNLNNHFGLPLSLLNLKSSHQIGIFEIGMNHPGEIAHLTPVADPDIVVVTNVGAAHLEGVGSLEGVAKEKAAIYQSARSDAIHIYNLDNEWTQKMYEEAKENHKCVTFSSQTDEADVFLKEMSAGIDFIEIGGRILQEPGRESIPIFGRHNLSNLMAASAIAVACGMEADSVWKVLPECRTAWGRNQLLQMESGTKVLFDGYNANPDSFDAFFDNISRLNITGKKYAIIGDMFELGEGAKDAHRELGKTAANQKFSTIWYIGDCREAFREGLLSVGYTGVLEKGDEKTEEIVSRWLKKLSSDDYVFCKASRGIGIETILKQFGCDL
jgi:UDP-N-acetylmuramoyl-tripeptide--D-alanyl-D-alanine ligase